MKLDSILVVTGLLGHVALMAQDTLHVQLHGTVLNTATGKPVYEALVEWYDARGHRQAITQSNSEGHYAMFIATTGAIELRVAEVGYAPFLESGIVFDPGESAREHDLHLVPIE